MTADPVPPASEDDGPDEWLTIDELVARTGMTSRTVRFYVTQGLVPAPVRRGRVGYYGRQHRMRLEFVRELQSFGYSLAGLDRYVRQLPDDVTPAELAVQRAMLVPRQPEPVQQLTRAELDQRAGRRLDDAAVELLLDIGVMVRRGDAFVARPSMLSTGIELLDLPVPREILRRAAAVIDEHAQVVADELSAVFRDGLWEPYRRGELAAVDSAQLATMLTRLRPLTVQGLVSAFEQAADRAIRGYSEESDPELAEPGPKSAGVADPGPESAGVAD